MKVAQLIALLQAADSDATVMIVPPGESEYDAEEVRCFTSSSVAWTREQGVDKGRPYETLYRGEPHHELRTNCERVTYESVQVVLLAADKVAAL
jgi:hypothetical protein